LLGRLLFFCDKAGSLSALRSHSVRCVPGYVSIPRQVDYRDTAAALIE